MGPERNRRIIMALIVSMLFLLSSWIDSDDSSESHPSVRASVKSAARHFGKSTRDEEDDGKEDANEASKKRRRHDFELLILDDTDEELSDDEDDEGDDETSAFSKTFKGKSQMYIRTSAFHFDLHACLPKFICEIHAHHVSNDLTELEKDIIGLFRNYVVLEGPGSPVYTYQLAAHMGQLVTGLDPSPCQNLYPTCPLSRRQLLDILRNVKSSRRMFY